MKEEMSNSIHPPSITQRKLDVLNQVSIISNCNSSGTPVFCSFLIPVADLSWRVCHGIPLLLILLNIRKRRRFKSVWTNGKTGSKTELKRRYLRSLSSPKYRVEAAMYSANTILRDTTMKMIFTLTTTKSRLPSSAPFPLLRPPLPLR